MIYIDKMVFAITSLNSSIFFFVLMKFSEPYRQQPNKATQKKETWWAEKDTQREDCAIPDTKEKLDPEAACSLCDDGILPWEAQGDGK